jgi:hypothetical protein
MESKFNIENIQEVFRGDFSTILKISDARNTWFIKSYFWVTFSITIFLMAFIIWFDNKLLIELIGKILNLVIPFFGALIGFSLSGYLLVAALGDESMLRNIAKIQLAKIQNRGKTIPVKLEFSFIQRVTAKYAVIVILQFSILILFIVVYLFSILGLSAINDLIARFLNCFILFSLIFMALYGTFLTLQLVVNIFILSQARNLSIFKEEQDKLNKTLAK